MASINPKLLSALRAKTGLSRPAVYARIQQAASDGYLPRNLAAIKVAADAGVPINRYASSEELAQLRHAGAPVTPPSTNGGVVAPTKLAREVQTPRSRSKSSKHQKSKAIPNQVFVVHGRDMVAKAALFEFLRAVGIKPIEWMSAIAMSKKAAPYVGDILTAAFQQARAVVVLLTPDDLAQLRVDLLASSDPPFERTLMGQARPNVLFECGMAFSSHPDQTVMVQIGSVRPFSDTFGRHVVHMTADPAKRQELATKLENAGCEVDRSGLDWLKVGDFSDPLTRAPSVEKRKQGRRKR